MKKKMNVMTTDYVAEYSKIMNLVEEYGRMEYDRAVVESLSAKMRLSNAISSLVTKAICGK